MLNQFSRTQLLLGEEGMKKLAGARVAVFGIGGVGGYVCEALVRSGVGAFDLIDDDKVCLTNLNRQIIATRKTVGKYKTDVMKERIHFPAESEATSSKRSENSGKNSDFSQENGPLPCHNSEFCGKMRQ